MNCGLFWGRKSGQKRYESSNLKVIYSFSNNRNFSKDPSFVIADAVVAAALAWIFVGLSRKIREPDNELLKNDQMFD